MFRKYESISRRFNERSYVKASYIVVTEKIDGANASFRKIDNDTVEMFKRNSVSNYKDVKGLRAFGDTINAEILNEDYTYYGEWTTPHKINYGENVNKFFIFDIYDNVKERYLHHNEVVEEAERIGFKTATVLYIGQPLSMEELSALANSYSVVSTEEVIREGVVVRYYQKDKDEFDKFKVVSDSFSEVKPMKKGKTQSGDFIKEFFDSTITPTRIYKSLKELERNNYLEGVDVENLDFTDIGTLLKSGLPRHVLNDIVEEEIFQVKDYLNSRFGKIFPPKLKDYIEQEMNNVKLDIQ